MKSHFHRQSRANLSTKDIEEKVAKKWMKKHGKEIHPVFAVESQYDSRLERYIPTEQAAIKYLIPSLSVKQVLNLLIHVLLLAT